jgi:hypothetical protein
MIARRDQGAYRQKRSGVPGPLLVLGPVGRFRLGAEVHDDVGALRLRNRSAASAVPPGGLEVDQPLREAEAQCPCAEFER